MSEKANDGGYLSLPSPQETAEALRSGQPGGGDLKSSMETVSQFKRAVDKVLDDFHESPAGPSKVGSDKLARTSLGGGSTTFHEANFLYQTYSNVHGQLENLSTALGLQIESMGLAVETSGKNINDLDEDVKTRMQRLNAQIEAFYVPSRDHYAAEKNAKPETPARGTTDTGGGKGADTTGGYQTQGDR